MSDYDGLRVQQTTSAGTTNYTVDPESGYGNVIEERGATGTLNARYDYGDDLIRMDRGSGVYYYIFDGLGSTRQLTDASGNVDNTDSYDAFGNIISSTGSVVNPYLFDGQEQDGTGLYYLRARYMDPTRGEFLSQDPYAGDDEDPTSLHRYQYADDDPANGSDPSGATPFSDNMHEQIQFQYVFDHPGNTASYGEIKGAVGAQYYDSNGWLPTSSGLTAGKNRYYPDIFDYTPGVYTINEIKPLFPQFNGFFKIDYGLPDGLHQMDKYLAAFGQRNAYSDGFSANTHYVPSEQPFVGLDGNAYFVINVSGVLAYCPIDDLAIAGGILDAIKAGIGRAAILRAYDDAVEQLTTRAAGTVLGQNVSSIETAESTELVGETGEATALGSMGAE